LDGQTASGKATRKEQEASPEAQEARRGEAREEAEEAKRTEEAHKAERGE
jgi:hypothetical protein